MSKSFRKDLTGQRFGRLTVLEFVSSEKKGAHWLCRCDCGNKKIIYVGNLQSGCIKSCGCLGLETLISRNTLHGFRRTRLYTIWCNMKLRCYNPNVEHYDVYGGRGITVCDEWLNDFISFRDWALSHGYTDNLSIDRIDNNKGYFPENCRFVDAKTQCRNRRSNIVVEYQGKKITIAELSEKIGINATTLGARYRKGDRGNRLFRPVQKHNKPTKEDG